MDQFILRFAGRIGNEEPAHALSPFPELGMQKPELRSGFWGGLRSALRGYLLKAFTAAASSSFTSKTV
jgi:hypothetical protein